MLYEQDASLAEGNLSGCGLPCKEFNLLILCRCSFFLGGWVPGRQDSLLCTSQQATDHLELELELELVLRSTFTADRCFVRSQQGHGSIGRALIGSAAARDRSPPGPERLSRP